MLYYSRVPLYFIRGFKAIIILFVFRCFLAAAPRCVRRVRVWLLMKCHSPPPKHPATAGACVARLVNMDTRTTTFFDLAGYTEPPF